MSTRNDDLMFLAGIFIGAIAGGIAAALLVPQSGTETREQVMERGLELKSRAEDVVQRAQQIASDTVVKVQSAANEMIGTNQTTQDTPAQGAGI